MSTATEHLARKQLDAVKQESGREIGCSSFRIERGIHPRDGLYPGVSSPRMPTTEDVMVVLRLTTIRSRLEIKILRYKMLADIRMEI